MVPLSTQRKCLILFLNYQYLALWSTQRLVQYWLSLVICWCWESAWLAQHEAGCCQSHSQILFDPNLYIIQAFKWASSWISTESKEKDYTKMKVSLPISIFVDNWSSAATIYWCHDITWRNMACHVVMPVSIVHKSYPSSPRGSYNMVEAQYEQLVSSKHQE